MLQFTDFFKLTIPCIVNFLVPASIMYFSVSRDTPSIPKEKIILKRGSKRIIFIFVLSVMITIVSDEILHIPTVADMMFGLTMLLFVSYYLNKSENRFLKVKHFSTEHEYKNHIDSQKGFDVFKCIAGVDWDTLLFFYGAMMTVGALDFLGYLNAMEHYFLTELNPTFANILIGLTSSTVDNGTLMFAVLKMNPHFPTEQWLFERRRRIYFYTSFSLDAGHLIRLFRQHCNTLSNERRPILKFKNLNYLLIGFLITNVLLNINPKVFL